MWLRCLGFALLVWIPGLLYAQRAPPCSAPDLNKGYFHPVQDSYSHDTIIYYGCDKGHKPAVEGWWATSRCLNGKWTHEPKCIDEDSCFAPNIDNAMPVEGLYTAGQKLQIQCKSGYEHESRDKTAECMNGQWTKVPVCRKRTGACEAPPQYPNAVIINHKYQEVFDENKELQYQCRDGYVGENGAKTKAVRCNGEQWEGGPNCVRSSSPTPTDGNIKPAITTIDKCGQFPVVKDGVNYP
ncbi:unnamed protein product [Menidia menidia]|uniref:(Atlantic silverside) hypothetical protein n=1 Tax=Menidia menidia TaxID=238744 RepID=A0A8S4AW85_9TELE|nr:unnamed protein product [Menidia menidia]